MAEDAYREHMARIRRIQALWEAGEIGTGEKQQRIAAENETYYEGRVPRALQAAAPHNQLADVLADALGVPLYRAERALQARRAASRAAADADDNAAARRARELSVQLYTQFLHGPDVAGEAARGELPPGEMREAG